MPKTGQTPDDEFLVFGAPRIETEEIGEVIRCLKFGWIGTGSRVAQFEREFATCKGPRARAQGNLAAPE